MYPSMLQGRKVLSDQFQLFQINIGTYNPRTMLQAIHYITPGINNHAIPMALTSIYVITTLIGSNNVTQVFN